jgi:hypothetical protein
MTSRGIQLFVTGIGASISLLVMITTTYGANIIIGGNHTDIGTIVIVSPKPGDAPLANGTALRNVLAGIDADFTNRYLIKLGPGIYALGATGLQMKEYVSIEGSGENATKITAAADGGSFPLTDATVIGADHAELRFLTTENTIIGVDFKAAILNSSASPSLIHVTVTTSGGSNNYGVYNYNSSPTMTNVTVLATGGTSNKGLYNVTSSPAMTNVTTTASGGSDNVGLVNSVSSPTMTNVAASASGGPTNVGILNSVSSLTMTNVTASASGGTTNIGIQNLSSGTIRISHSVIKGTTTISNPHGVTTYVGNTQLDGEAVSNSGTLTCVGAYNGNYVALGTNCQ